MTDKPKAPPGPAKGSFAGRSIQAELDSVMLELEQLNFDGSDEEDDVELELAVEEPVRSPAPRSDPPRPPEARPVDARPLEPRAPEPRPTLIGVDPARVAQLEQELEAWKQKAQRSASEFDAIRKRLVREKQDAGLFANEQLVRDLLPVVDTLWLAVEHASPERYADLLSGLKMTATLFVQALAKHGVETFDAKDAAFDPRLHQAVSLVPTREVAPGKVLAVAQRGFTINGRLLRPALVSVAAEPMQVAPPPLPEPIAEAGVTIAEEPRRRRSVPGVEIAGRVGAEPGDLRPRAASPSFATASAPPRPDPVGVESGAQSDGPLLSDASSSEAEVDEPEADLAFGVEANTETSHPV